MGKALMNPRSELVGELQVLAYEPALAAGIVEVVRRVHDEYGFTWDAGGYHRDLYDIDACYLKDGGMFWALCSGRGVVGCVGVTLHGSVCELHRLYLLREVRRQGWGRRLLHMTEDYGRLNGCRRMICWSDVLLKDAHRLYLHEGFTQEGERICDDPDQSREYGFWKEPL